MKARVALVLFAGAAGGCELVLGSLPATCEELGSCTGTSGTGGEGATTATTGGAAGSGGASTTGGGGAGGTGGTTTGTGGTGGSTGTSTTTDTCDMDGDMVTAQSCGGTDCDDTRKSIPAPETQYFTMEDPVVGFDYNCSGFPEIDPKHDIHVDCAGQLTHPNCDALGTGYLATPIPMCGQPGNWGTCMWVGNDVLGTCQNQSINMNELMPCH